MALPTVRTLAGRRFYLYYLFWSRCTLHLSLVPQPICYYAVAYELQTLLVHATDYLLQHIKIGCPRTSDLLGPESANVARKENKLPGTHRIRESIRVTGQVR